MNIKKWGDFISIRKNYHRITRMENWLTGHAWQIPEAEEMEGTAYQIGQVALAGTVNRSYIKIYGLSSAKNAFESDSAHTNLMSTVVDRALSHLYGPDHSGFYAGYTYREVMEAVRRHDLPENITGDAPDNGTQNLAKKFRAEIAYHQDFSRRSPHREANFDFKVNRLLVEMAHKNSTMGRILYVADKICAILMALCYDSIDRSPVRLLNDTILSDQDRAEMSLCDCNLNGHGCLASEMWTADYLKIRHLVDYDDTGYFTALLIMYTLQVKGKWYAWRQKDYASLV